MCVGNRNATYPLCGGCNDGYSQSITTLNCVPDSLFGGTAAAGYAFGQIAYWLAYDAFVLFQAKYAPLLARLQWLPEKLKPKATTEPNNGAVNVLIFFFQLAQIAVPNGPENAAGAVYAWLGELFSLENLPEVSSSDESSSGGGVCMSEGYRMFHVLSWQLFAPLMPAIMLLLYGFLLARYRAFQSAPSHDANEANATAIGADGDKTVDADAAEDSTNDLGVALLGGDIAYGSEASSASSFGPAKKNQNKQSFAKAVAGLCLLGYTGMTQAALRLLRCACVDTLGSGICEAGQSVLYFAGQDECTAHYTSWQTLVMLLVMMLVVMPLTPVMVWLLCQLPPASKIGKWARAQRWPQDLVMYAVKANATEAFASTHWHWAAVLALQRLFTVMCRTFSSQPAQATLAVTMVSLAFMMFQVCKAFLYMM
jgi:hypothetical protein